MNEKLIILGHENPDVDSIVSGYILEKILKKKGYKAEFIIPDDKIDDDTQKICKKYGLNPSKFLKKIPTFNAKYILVDHNERKLEGKIVLIIDHHVTNRKTNSTYYYNKKISSTACFICKGNEHFLTPKDLKLALIATMVDTASFNSDKGTIDDKNWVLDICCLYNFNYDELYKDGLCLTNISDLDKALLNGLKKYNFNNKKIESSYFQIENNQINAQLLKKVFIKLSTYIKEKCLDAFLFIIHDMTNFKTTYFLITKNGIIKKKYKNYTSRGNTIIPEIKKISK